MLTVLFATYNGAQTLNKVLPAYCQLIEPEGGWKLVIADNASTDETKSIVDSFADKLPLTYLYESKRGKNAALNTGLAEVEGDLVVLTDDDAIPNKDWLVALRQCADEHPGHHIFGGKILPEWTLKAEDWILQQTPLGVAFALTDDSMKEGEVEPSFIWGPNMAVRREVYNEGHRFNEDIGPSGKNYAMGSETEFTVRMSHEGYKCWHSEIPVVRHIIRENQMNKKWVLGRAVRYGRGLYRMNIQRRNRHVPTIAGVPRYLFPKMLKQGVRVLFSSLFKRDQVFAERWEFNELVGVFKEARIEHAGKR